MNLLIVAPCAGWAAPLSDVPDPVFAQGLLGDGIAIDPLEPLLRAPCDGVVIKVSPTRHAITLRTLNGAELLLHVGLDTVNLRGHGFTALVQEGQQLRRGDPLLHVDLDEVARLAPDLITPLVIANSDQFTITRRWQNRALDAGSPLLEIAPRENTVGPEAAPGSAPSQQHELALSIGLDHGLHARPAAKLAARAREFDCTIILHAREHSVDVLSAVSVMGLALAHGENIRLTATGREAETALNALAALIAPQAGPASPDSDNDDHPTSRGEPGPSTPLTSGTLAGVAMTRGIALGAAFRLPSTEAQARQVKEYGEGVEQERTRLARARAAVATRLAQTTQASSSTQRDILAAHSEFLHDPELHNQALRLIDQGKSAGFAWSQAVQRHIDLLQHGGNPHIALRTDDLKDIQQQVLAALSGHDATPVTLPPDTILLADDLLPSQLLRLPAGQLAGLAIARGGATSHVAILAGERGIPAVAALGAALAAIADGTPVILDADQALLEVNPGADRVRRCRTEVQRRQKLEQTARHAARDPAQLIDGPAIAVHANLAGSGNVAAALDHGAEGCGLLRSEFLFEDRRTPPGEEEQRQIYQGIVDDFGGRPVVIRTLDIGGDKSVPFLTRGRGENPALGARGIRLRQSHPELLQTQLRAIAGVTPRAACRVLLPMVSSVDEVLHVRELLQRIDSETGMTEPLQLGAMIETPASALIADHLSAQLDFLAIGSNDLTQYVLAMDRADEQLAHQFDALHPAVLRIIAITCDRAADHDTPVSVCGAMAADPLAIPILLGLGVRRLSVASSDLPRVKQAIRQWRLDDCRQLAREALRQPTLEAVRALAAGFIAKEAEL